MSRSSSDHRPAVFLDRDGTLNVEVNYLYRVADLVIIPGTAQAIQRLNAAGYIVVVVSNQAGIARGYYDEQALQVLQTHFAAVLAEQDARVDGWYWCPHHPDFSGPCDCRKPRPGMLRQAAFDHGIDFAQSWIVGDTLNDVAAGQAVGCRTLLVRTGYGRKAELELNPDVLPPNAVVDDLGAAVKLILEADATTPIKTDEERRLERSSVS
jgi:D-glycero-D-manno-heptose 1,7-bisphosphate phosphatase